MEEVLRGLEGREKGAWTPELMLAAGLCLALSLFLKGLRRPCIISSFLKGFWCSMCSIFTLSVQSNLQRRENPCPVRRSKPFALACTRGAVRGSFPELKPWSTLLLLCRLCPRQLSLLTAGTEYVVRSRSTQLVKRPFLPTPSPSFPLPFGLLAFGIGKKLPWDSVCCLSHPPARKRAGNACQTPLLWTSAAAAAVPSLPCCRECVPIFAAFGFGRPIPSHGEFPTGLPKM